MRVAAKISIADGHGPSATRRVHSDEGLARRLIGAVMLGSLTSICVLIVTADARAQAPAADATLSAVNPAGATVDNVDQRLQEIAAAVRGGRRSDELVSELIELLQRIDAKDPARVKTFTSTAFILEELVAVARDSTTGKLAGRTPEQLIDLAVDGYLRGAALARDAGDLITAEMIYNRVLSHRRYHGDSILNLARIYASTQRTLQAIDKYKQYLTALETGNISAVRDPQVYLELGKAYTQVKFFAQAMRALDEAAKLAPSNAEVQIQMAATYAEQGKLEDALRAATRARQLAPNNPLYISHLARLLMASQQPEQALQAAREAVQTAQTQLSQAADTGVELRTLIACFDNYLEILAKLVSATPDNLAVRLELSQGIQGRALAHRFMSLSDALQVLIGAPQWIQLKAALDGSRPDVLSPAELATEQNVDLLRRVAAVQFELAHKDLAQTCEYIRRLDPDNRLMKLDPRHPLAQQIYGGGTATQSAPSGG